MPYVDRDALRAYQRLWIAQRRAVALAGRSCQFCGTTERLEFHHFDRYAKVTHKVWSWAPERRDAELAKCLVLCHDCHVAQHPRPRFCRRGHELTQANSYVKPDGRRECRTCKNRRQLEWLARTRAAQA